MRRHWQITCGFLSLVLLGLLLLGPAGAKLPLIRSEAMYAEIPLEMLTTGDWLTPRLNGARYFDKPPLLYWLNLLAYLLSSPGAAAARWATALIGVGEISGLFALGSLLFSPAVGWLGGLVLLTSLGFFALHLQILTDHLITLTLTWAVFFLAWWERRPGTGPALGFHLCGALGFLAKGLIGLGFPWAVALLYALVRQEKRFRRLLFHPGGLLLSAGVSLPWFVIMEWRYPGFINYHLVNEQILRFLGQRWPADINSLPLPVFWLFALIWLLPWSALLIPTLAALRPPRWRELGPDQGPLLLLLLWASVILVFFSLSSSRIEYYMLPALPPLALLIGWRLQHYLATPQASGGFRLYLLLPAIAVVGLTVSLPSLEQICAANRREFIGLFDQLQPLSRQALPLLALGFCLAAWAGWRQLPRLAVAGLGSAALILLYFTFHSLRLLSPHLSDAWAAAVVQQIGQPDDILVMGHIEEFEYGMSLKYYTQKRILMVQRQGLPEFGFPLLPEEKYLLPPEKLLELWQGPQRVIILEDNCAPEEYLPNPFVVALKNGKRLITNKPLPAGSLLAAGETSPGPKLPASN